MFTNDELELLNLALEHTVLNANLSDKTEEILLQLSIKIDELLTK